MPEYREQPVEGKQWLRIKRVQIENPRGAPPTLSAIEERAIQLGDDLLLKELGITLTAGFDPAGEFALRHPLTDELLGRTATQQELQIIVYSFCRHLQTLRDSPPEPAPEPGALPV